MKLSDIIPIILISMMTVLLREHGRSLFIIALGIWTTYYIMQRVVQSFETKLPSDVIALIWEPENIEQRYDIVFSSLSISVEQTELIRMALQLLINHLEPFREIGEWNEQRWIEPFYIEEESLQIVCKSIGSQTYLSVLSLYAVHPKEFLFNLLTIAEEQIK